MSPNFQLLMLALSFVVALLALTVGLYLGAGFCLMIFIMYLVNIIYEILNPRHE